jgi:hypothetical protein
MRQVTLALALVLTSACASSSTTPGAAAPMTQTVRVASGSGNDRLNFSGGGAGPTTHTLNASADRVWRVLPAMFDSIGVPVSTIDQAQKVIGNEGYKVRARLKNVNLSRYVDCGQTQIGPNADSYEVWLVLLVQVRPVAGSTTTSSLTTTFQASARPVTFSQGYSNCTTNATLEKRILDVVNAQLK